jgi:uncharacterized protein YndB with AHSA1/START domain
MSEKTDQLEAPADRLLVLTRVFHAPRPLVFEAWTKKEHLQKWYAPRGFTIQQYHGDARPGGGWGCLMIAPDGSKNEVTGVYQQVVPDELLVMTHGWQEDDGSRPYETIVTVRSADDQDGTRLTLEQSVFRSVAGRNLHQAGWTQSWEKIDELLALETGRKT